MQLLGGDLFLSFEDLTGYGIPEKTVKNGVWRHNKGETLAWVNLPDPMDRRKTLVQYRSLPEYSQTQIPKLEALIEQYKSQEASSKVDDLKGHLAKAHVDLEHALNSGWVALLPDWLKLVSRDEAPEHAKAEAVLKECMRLTAKGTPNRITVVELHPIFEALDVPRIKANNHKTLERKIKKARLEGTKSVLKHGLRGRANARKMTEQTEQLIYMYYSSPKQYSGVEICRLVNAHAETLNEEHGLKLKPLKESSIKGVMARPETKNRYDLYRYGNTHYSNTQRPYQPRLGAIHPGDLWVIDGTPLQFYFKNPGDPSPRRLNFFAVLDVHSRKVVGVDFSLSENRWNVINSLHMAAKREGHLPYEILSDNFSALSTDEWKAIEEGMQAKGTIYRRSQVGNAKDKPIERWISTFQTEFCKLLPVYIGEGIRSKRLTGRPAPETIEKTYKALGHPTQNELEALILKLVGRYNSTERKTLSGRNPAKCYADGPYPYARKVGAEDIALLFWLSREVTVRRSMVQLTIDKVDYHYQIFAQADKVRLNGRKVKAFYDLSDLSSIHLFDSDGDEYFGEFRQYKKAHIAQANQSSYDVERIIKNEANHKALKGYIEEQNRKDFERAFAGLDIQQLNPLTSPKLVKNEAEGEALASIYFDSKGKDKEAAQAGAKRFVEYDPAPSYTQPEEEQPRNRYTPKGKKTFKVKQ